MENSFWDTLLEMLGFAPQLTPELEMRDCFLDELPGRQFKLTFVNLDEYIHYMNNVFCEMLKYHDTSDPKSDVPTTPNNKVDELKKYEPMSLRDAYLKPKNPVLDHSENTIMAAIRSMKAFPSLFHRNDGSIYSQSVQVKSTVNPDGTIKQVKTIRDHEGNVKTILSTICNNERHTTIKKKDKNGKEEIIETIVNVGTEGN